MKTAIYIEDGITQLVLTPETEFERGIVSKVVKGKQECHIHNGSFFECRGGWVRQGSDDSSLILVVGIEPID